MMMRFARWALALTIPCVAVACSVADGEEDGDATDTSAEALGAKPLDDEPDPNDTVSAKVAGCNNSIGFERELLIRDLSVVEGKDATGQPLAEGAGPWSFGTLMTHLAGPRDPAAMVREWIGTYEKDIEVQPTGGARETLFGNPENVRDAILDAWPTKNGNLDLERAPFRLLAVGFRPDLREVAPHSAGEVRLVFGAFATKSGLPMPMTVAFEYTVPAATPADAVQFTKSWHTKLSTSGAVGTRTYLDALEKLVDGVIKPGANPSGVNGSALGQLRTNEVLVDTPWNLRQFALTAKAGGSLVPETMPNTPLITLNGSDKLAGFVKNGKVPTSVETGMAAMPSSDFSWRPMKGVSAAERRKFALMTCNGCHSAETKTNFLQLHPRERGKATALSDFLASSSKHPLHMKDPQSGDPIVIKEQDRRIDDYNSVLCAP